MKQFKLIVKALYSNARCENWGESSYDHKTYFYIIIDRFRGDEPVREIIGRGLSPYLAWKNAAFYVGREMMRKLES